MKIRLCFITENSSYQFRFKEAPFKPLVYQQTQSEILSNGSRIHWCWRSPLCYLPRWWIAFGVAAAVNRIRCSIARLPLSACWVFHFRRFRWHYSATDICLFTCRHYRIQYDGDLYVTDGYTGEKYLELRNLILPALALGIRPVAVITQLTRSAMIDVMNNDYIRMARAKGLNERVILFRHAPQCTESRYYQYWRMAGEFTHGRIFYWILFSIITASDMKR